MNLLFNRKYNKPQRRKEKDMFCNVSIESHTHTPAYNLEDINTFINNTDVVKWLQRSEDQVRPKYAWDHNTW